MKCQHTCFVCCRLLLGCPSKPKYSWARCLSLRCTHTQAFYGPFSGTLPARIELLNFLVQGKINRGRHTNHLAGHHSIWTNQCPPPPSPPVLQAGCPSCCPTNRIKALKADVGLKIFPTLQKVSLFTLPLIWWEAYR